jgi:hypothetical protein
MARASTSCCCRNCRTTKMTKPAPDSGATPEPDKRSEHAQHASTRGAGCASPQAIPTTTCCAWATCFRTCARPPSACCCSWPCCPPSCPIPGVAGAISGPLVDAGRRATAGLPAQALAAGFLAPGAGRTAGRWHALPRHDGALAAAAWKNWCVRAWKACLDHPLASAFTGLLLVLLGLLLALPIPFHQLPVRRCCCCCSCSPCWNAMAH